MKKILMTICCLVATFMFSVGTAHAASQKQHHVAHTKKSHSTLHTTTAHSDNSYVITKYPKNDPHAPYIILREWDYNLNNTTWFDIANQYKR